MHVCNASCLKNAASSWKHIDVHESHHSAILEQLPEELVPVIQPVVGAAVAVTSERRPTLGWSLFLTLSEYSRLVQHVLMHGYIPSPPKVNLIDA